MPAAPFIVTAELPADVFAWADGLRRAHYPTERNWLAAHVTLFHSFAPSLRDELPRVLARLAAEFAPPMATLSGLMPLGTGTALSIASPGMLNVRAHIAERFAGALTAQDQHKPRLHITIQNKVTSQAAKALQRELEHGFETRTFCFTGLALHLYCNPHWELQGRWRFRGKQGS